MVACTIAFYSSDSRITGAVCRQCGCTLYLLFILTMKRIGEIFKRIGKLISKVIVSLTLTLVYFLIIAPYSLFVRFQRLTIHRNHTYESKDLDRMF